MKRDPPIRRVTTAQPQAAATDRKQQHRGESTGKEDRQCCLVFRVADQMTAKPSTNQLAQGKCGSAADAAA